MGADQNLIRAAAQMAPKEYDYSGILYAIQAIGKYANAKNAVADELAAYGDQNFNTKEFNDQFFTGAYGDQNMDFLINKKNQYYEAVQVTRTAPSYTKRYKDAVKNINNIKLVLEKNKADAEKFVQVQQGANNAWLNRSNGISFEAEDRLADIVTNPYTGKISASLVMSDNGLQIIAPSMMSTKDEKPLEIPINEGMSPAYNNVTNLADIMAGYKENIVYKKIKLPGDQTQTIIIGDELDKLIEKYGKNAKQSGQSIFEKEQIEQELTALMDKVKKLGPDALRSLAYDYKINGSTFVEANSYAILNKTDEQWVEMTRKSTKIGDIEFTTTANVEPYVNRLGETVTPEHGADEIAQMKKHTLSHAFSTNNYDVMESGLKKYITEQAKKQFTTYKPKVSSRDNYPTPMAGVYLAAEKIPIIVETISEEGYEKNPTMNFSVGSVSFEYSKVLDGDLKGKMAWQYNYGEGEYAMSPIPATAGPGTAGTSKALHYFLDKRPDFDFLLDEDYKFKGGK